MGLVLQVNHLSSLFVLLLELLGLLQHLVDLILGKTSGRLDGDGVILASGFILGIDVYDTVCIDIESDLNLGHSAGSRRDAGKIELAQDLVISYHLTFSLEDTDSDGSLVISSGGVDLRLLGRNGGVSGDHLGHHSSEGLNTEGKRGHVQKEKILHIALEHSTLDSSTHSHSLIGIYGFIGDLFENFLDDVDHSRHTGHTTDKDNLVDLVFGEIGVLDAVLAGLDGSLQEIVSKCFELSTGKLEDEVLGA